MMRISRPVLSVALGVLFVFSFGCSADKEPDWITVQPGDLVVTVELNGTLKAAKSLSYGAPTIPNMWEFKLTALSTEGEVVKKGDPLFSFDPSSLRERLMAKKNKQEETQVELVKKRQEITLARSDDQLRIVEAEAALRKATMNADLSEELTGNIQLQKAKIALLEANENLEHLRAQSKLTMSNRQRSVASMEATVRQSKAAVTVIEESIAKLDVKSHGTGTLVYETNYRGEKTKVGQRVWGNVLEVASLDSMIAEATVDEANSANLAIGQTVHLKLEAHPDNDVRGKLTKIGNTIQQKSNDDPVKVVAVELSVESVEGLQMRPGMRFRGEIEIERRTDVLVLPISAVFSSRQGPMTYKRGEDGTVPTLVRLGAEGKRSVEILGGLNQGDQVSATDLAKSKQ